MFFHFLFVLVVYIENPLFSLSSEAIPPSSIEIEVRAT
tara:strand:+ start:532 stop:645 length:114 start_codon:yes stop_codon:yes gene_type:complete